MKLIDMKPDFILDSDTETEVIHMHYEEISNGMFYFKHKFLRYDFKGNEIKDPDDYIRIKSLWYIDLESKNRIEIIPFGDFDINDAKVMGSYLYYTKITDKDNDGLLKDDYYSGDIYRIKLKGFGNEYCCDTVPYIFHGFEVASERYIIFRSEDQIPDTEELVFHDLKNKKKAVITNSWDTEEIGYRFILDEQQNPRYVVTKKFIFDGELSSANNKLMCFEWNNFLSKLEWNEIK